MTLDQMADTLSERVPTAAEFIAFTKAQNWQIRKREDGTASLIVPSASDVVAVALAKMLKREPWRSQVLALAGDSTLSAKPEQVTQSGSYAERIRVDPRNPRTGAAANPGTNGAKFAADVPQPCSRR
mgnify:CR=1 FL=1